MKHYKQLTYEQRCQIEVLKKSGFTQVEIGAAVGVSQSTISRELARNTGLRSYRHKQAQRTAMARRESARRAVKMTPELTLLINKKGRKVESGADPFDRKQMAEINTDKHSQ